MSRLPTLSIFTTVTNPIERGDPYSEAMNCYRELADEVVVVDGNCTSAAHTESYKQIDSPWPQEFEWKFIGEQFQRGYEACTGDWVLHMDIDFVFHEKDYQRIREVLHQYRRQVAVTFWKWQIFTPDRYNLKSRLVVAVNKGYAGNKIKFNGGGDLAQPTLNDIYLSPNDLPEARIPFYNYDDTFKTKEQIMEDKGRFARAWHKSFGEFKLAGPDDESAYDKWWEMVIGRYKKHTNYLKISDHPKVMQESLANLSPSQLGFDMFGYKHD